MERSISHQERDIVKEPLSREEIIRIVRALPNGIQGLDNPYKKNDPAYLQEIANKQLSEEQLIDVYTRHPHLIATPILMTEEWAGVGYLPPEELASRLGVPA